MPEVSFEERILRIFRKDPRYHPDAYYFISQALTFTQDQIGGQHASGQYLLEGIRRYALLTFGPTAHRTMDEWGIHRCEDFGELVFNLVEAGAIAADEKDSRDDFRGGYDFTTAFPEPSLSKTFFTILCHVFFDDEELADLGRRFREDGTIDQDWLAAVRIDPFITNSPPSGQQMSDFHTLLEVKGEAVLEARFDKVIAAFETFGQKACGWETKPDLMMHDLLVELEPYCSAFVKEVLVKLHLTPDVEPDATGVDGPPVLLSGRDVNSPRGFQTTGEQDDIETPERDLTPSFSGFGHAPPVDRELRVYVNKALADWLQVSRDGDEESVRKIVLMRPRVAARLKSKNVHRVVFVQKHLHVNVCIDAAPLD